MKPAFMLLTMLVFCTGKSAAAQSGDCDNLNALEIFVEIFQNDSPSATALSTTITIYKTDGTFVTSHTVVSRPGCDFHMNVSPISAGPEPVGDFDCAENAETMELCDTDAFVIAVGGRAWVYSWRLPSRVSIGSLYNPDDNGNSADFGIGYFQAGAGDDGNGNGSPTVQAMAIDHLPHDNWTEYYESVFGSNYAMPYNFDDYCAVVGGCSNVPGYFVARHLAPIPAPQSAEDDLPPFALDFTFGSLGPVTIEESWPDVTWDASDVTLGDLTLRFPARTQLIAEGSLAMDGVTLTEAVAGEGWYGVLYQPNGGGVIRGTTIEKFGHNYSGGGSLFAPSVCGLTVNDRWLAVHRSTIQNGFNSANGVCSIGDNAQVALRGEINPVTQLFERTEVKQNDGDGLRATSQGRFIVRDTDVFGNGGNGGSAIGTGSGIRGVRSTFSNNVGVGLAAYSDGYVILDDPAVPGSLGENTLDANEGGGLLATGQGSYINAGTFNGGGSARGTCGNACENNILNHDLPGIPFDAKASGGSLVFAEFDFWGDGRTQESDLNLDEDATSTIEVLPIWDGTSSLMRGGPTAVKMPAEPSGFGETTRGLVVMALESAAQGRWTPAFAHAQAAVALAATNDDLQMAMGAASAVVGHPGAPEMPTGLLQVIEVHLGAGQHGRPYALRSLLTAHRTHDRDTDARAMAASLIADFPLTEHALTGLAQEVELALEADDLPGAQAALATMETDFPDELLTETTRAYFVLVAGEEALPQGATATPLVASASTANASTNAQARGFALLAAYPNPFNPQAMVPFSVATTARVRITVFDMLGREVLTLADGRYEVGVYETVFDGSLLPSGMYLVRASVTPENGDTASAFIQRLTLLK